jgi:membrane protease subunit HflC
MDSVKTSLNGSRANMGCRLSTFESSAPTFPTAPRLLRRSIACARRGSRGAFGRAQGAKQAQIIRAEADAEAAKTYAASFGKDPQFYDFYRAMQSYQLTFIGDGQDKVAPTTIILSPQDDYLKEFSGRGK